jgi:hypothetical protein
MWFFKKKKQTGQDILIERIKAEQLDMQGLFSNINKRGDVEAYSRSCLSYPTLTSLKRIQKKRR